MILIKSYYSMAHGIEIQEGLMIALNHFPQMINFST